MDKSLLLRVLSPGEEPAPFYCFLQIQQQANALPPHQQTQFAAWTAAALASASRKGVGGDVFLALKCARAYKTLLKLSLPGLKQLLLQGGAEPLRALLNLRLPPHPLQGDAPCAAVRSEAAAAMEFLFAYEEAPTETGTGSQGGIAVGGGALRPGSVWTGSANPTAISNPHMPCPGGSSASSAATPREQALRLISSAALKYLPESLQKHLPASVVEGATGAPAQLSAFSGRSHSYASAEGSAAAPGGSYASYVPSAPAASFKSGSAPSPWSRGGSGGCCVSQKNFSGFAARPPSETQPGGAAAFSWNSNSLPDGVAHAPSALSAAASATGASLSVQQQQPQPQSVSCGEFEAKAVTALAEPCGARLQPSKASLEAFVEAGSAGEAQVLCCLLQEQLASESVTWQSKLRLLYGVQALLQRESASPAQTAKLSFRETALANLSSEVRQLSALPQLRGVSTAVLNLLDNNNPTAPPSATTAAHGRHEAQPPSPAADASVDLLSLDEQSSKDRRQPQTAQDVSLIEDFDASRCLPSAAAPPHQRRRVSGSDLLQLEISSETTARAAPALGHGQQQQPLFSGLKVKTVAEEESSLLSLSPSPGSPTARATSSGPAAPSRPALSGGSSRVSSFREKDKDLLDGFFDASAAAGAGPSAAAACVVETPVGVAVPQSLSLESEASLLALHQQRAASSSLTPNPNFSPSPPSPAPRTELLEEVFGLASASSQTSNSATVGGAGQQDGPQSLEGSALLLNAAALAGAFASSASATQQQSPPLQTGRAPSNNTRAPSSFSFIRSE